MNWIINADSYQIYNSKIEYFKLNCYKIISNKNIIYQHDENMIATSFKLTKDLGKN